MLRPRLLIVSRSAVLLSAFVVAPYPRRVVYTEPVSVDSSVVADVPPPAPYVEIVPAIPFPGAIWIGGYWGRRGGRYR